MPLRVLIVSYYFPPAGGGGVQRVLSWARHLPSHGIEVTVAAPEQPKWVDEDTTLVVPPATQVIRTPDPSPAAVIPTHALAGTRGVRRLLRRLALQPRRFAVPDIHRRWRQPAVASILRAARELGGPDGTPAWDVVISSSPPETTHLVARDVATQLGIPWIADLRDSWLDLPHLRMDSPVVRWKHRANVRLATRIMRDAAAATTVSEPLATDLRARHPGLEVHVLENGIELPQVQRAQTRADGFRDVGRFVVAYTGNFFGRQSARTFLEGAALALGREPALAEDLLLRFVGGLKPDERALATEPGSTLATVVDHIEFLRHDDVLAQQGAADLLLFYVAPGRGSQGVYTGKVFEYVAARRPVLALAPADNVAADLLERAGSTDCSGGARVDPDDFEAISSALLSAWRTWRDAGGRDGRRTSDVPVPADVLASIDRAQAAERLATLLATHARTS